MVDAIDQTHPAAGEHFLYLIEIENDVADLPDGGDFVWIGVVQWKRSDETEDSTGVFPRSEHFPRSRVTVFRVHGDGFVDDCRERLGDRGIAAAHGDDGFVEDDVDRVAVACELVGELGGEQVIDRRAHAPDVADGLGVFEVDDLFARQEERGAGVGAGEGEAAEAGFGEVFGEAEVGDFARMG